MQALILKTLARYAALIISGVFINISATYAQSWQQISDFAPGTRYAAAAFAIGGKGYVSTGLVQASNTYMKDTWEYDPCTDTWTQKADFPGAPRIGTAYFAIGNKAYVGLGGSGGGGTVYSDVYEYTPSTNTWIQKNNFPGPSRYLGFSFAITGKGYTGTGYPGLLSDFWEYDPASDSWSQKSSFPGGPRQATAGLAIGNKGYAGLGSTTFGAVIAGPTDWWEYDPINDSWTQKSSFSGAARFEAVGFELNNLGYIGTGAQNISTYHSDFWSYDPASDTWTFSSLFAGAGRKDAVSFVINNIAYVGTGGVANSGFKDFYAFPNLVLSGSGSRVDTVLCSGEQITLFPSSGDSIKWIPSTGLSCDTCFNPVASPSQSMQYIATIYQGCTVQDTFNIIVSNNTVNSTGDTTIVLGDTAQLQGQATGQFSWSPSNTLSCSGCLNPFATPTSTTVYYLQSIDSSGCVGLDSVIVVVKTGSDPPDGSDNGDSTTNCPEVIFPNAFTPNSDGLNDLFSPLAQPEKIHRFEIYNRWGELIYETKDLSTGWNGTYRGVPQGAGVYVYLLNYSCNGQEEIIYGNLTLLR